MAIWAGGGLYAAQMGARGPHDDFEAAEEVIRSAFADYAEHEDFDRICDDYTTDDLEYVTRNGTFRGPEQLKSEIAAQGVRWRFENEMTDLVDAGEGAVIAITEFKRLDKDTGEVAWKTWPATVLRVLDGKIVFWEGYVDSRKALEDFGVEQHG
jgi:limonene-1,2-epoxide hydrolase